jgi:predicted RNase H-like HicB family nuclease
MTKPQPDWDTPLQFKQVRRFSSHSGWVSRETGEHGLSAFWEPLGEGGEPIFLDTHITLEQLPGIIATRLGQALQVRRLEEQIAELGERLGHLEATQVHAKEATIQTFAPEPYELRAPIRVTLEESDSGAFVASFFDANIEASGETEQEAFGNLKNLILDVFDSLANEKPGKLGPEPMRQLAVLRSFIRGA